MTSASLCTKLKFLLLIMVYLAFTDCIHDKHKLTYSAKTSYWLLSLLWPCYLKLPSAHRESRGLTLTRGKLFIASLLIWDAQWPNDFTMKHTILSPKHTSMNLIPKLLWLIINPSCPHSSSLIIVLYNRRVLTMYVTTNGECKTVATNGEYVKE